MERKIWLILDASGKQLDSALKQLLNIRGKIIVISIQDKSWLIK